MSIKCFFFFGGGGGILGGGGGECRFYFYGRADFSDLSLFHHFFARLPLPDSFCGRVKIRSEEQTRNHWKKSD